MDGSEKLVHNDQLVDEAIGLLRDLLHVLLDSSMPAWLHLKLTLPQLRALFLIAHGETSTVMQISQHLMIGEPTASHLIDRLVQADLVERREDPQDRRRALVQLSLRGAQLIENLLGWENSFGSSLYRISHEDLAALNRGLTAIKANMPKQEDLQR